MPEACLSIVGITVLVCVALVVLSIDSVRQNQYGLKYNWITKAIGTEVFHGGTHFIGFWSAFIAFPATVQSIEFSDRFSAAGQRLGTQVLHTRTKEGLALDLSISFQYMLVPEEIPKLYSLTNLMYENLFMRIARDQILEAASEYEGPQYWLERQKIGNHMKTLVNTQMQLSHSKLWGLQLLVIDLPDKYEQSITMTQVQHQIIKTRRNEQAAASIRADTDVLRASFQRQVQVVQADAQANYTLETRMAAAEAQERKIAAEADALRYLRQKLALSAMGAVQYQELSALGDLPNATFLANMPVAPVMMGFGGSAPGLLQKDDSRRESTTTQLTGAAAVSGQESVGSSASGASSRAVAASLRARRRSDQMSPSLSEPLEQRVSSFFRGHSLASAAF